MTEPERTALIASIIAKTQLKTKLKERPQTIPDRYNLGQYYENRKTFSGEY